MLIVAQLWKQNGDKLENKNGIWMYMEETWILPNEITTNEIHQILSLEYAVYYSQYICCTTFKVLY